MTNLEFVTHFAEHLFAGLLIVAATLCANLLLLRRYFYSLFDPLLFFTILSAMAGAVIVYLSVFELVQPYYFWSYAATQAAFIIGFLLFRPVGRREHHVTVARGACSGSVPLLYQVCLFLFVVAQLAVYLTSGIPLLLESRLEAFSGGGGYGLLSRLLFVTSIVTVSIATYRILFVKRRLGARCFDYFALLFNLMVALLSGSKGALLTLIFTASLSVFYARRFLDTAPGERRLSRWLSALIVLAFPVAVFTIYVQSDIEEVPALLLALATRFISTGDIFFMSYPNEVLETLPARDGLLALFYAPVGALRLVNREDLPVNLGLQVFWYHYATDLLTGPNARHNIFGLHYFGTVFSILFSFILGILLGFCRNTLYRLLPPNPIGMVSYVLIFSCAVFIEQDVSGQAIEYFFSALVVFFPIYTLCQYFYVHGVGSRMPPSRPPDAMPSIAR